MPSTFFEGKPIIYKKGWKIMSKIDFGMLINIENNRSSNETGFTYVLEWGNKVKIGCTMRLQNRIRTLMRDARYGDIEIGKIAVSRECINYKENERALHLFFTERRIMGTELFKISFRKTMTDMPSLEFNINKTKEAV